MTKMQQAMRLLTAVALPPATVALYEWAYHKFGFGNSELAGWLALLGPTLVGATIIATMPWPTSPKIGIVIAYLAVTLAIVVFTGIMVSCSYGDCL